MGPQQSQRGHLFVLGIPVKVKVLGFAGSFLCRRPGLWPVGRGSGSRWSARSAARTNDLDTGKVDGMLIGLAMGTGPRRGQVVMFCPWSVGVCWGPCACRRPDLFGSTDTAVWRHDEDGVPGVRAAEGCGPLSLFRSSTQTVATVSLRERAASIS